MRAACLLILLLVVPSALAIESQRTHVHDEYIIPYNVGLGGLGGGLLQGDSHVHVTYDPVLADSDELDDNGTIIGRVAVNAIAPGSNVQATTITVSVTNSDCSSSVVVASSGTATTTSYATTVLQFTWTDGDLLPESCQAIVHLEAVAGGGTIWEINAPVRFYNDDAPVDGDGITDFWLPLLSLVVALVWCLHPDRLYLLAAVGVTTGILFYLLSDWPGGYRAAVFMALAGYWLQVIAADKVLARFFTRLKGIGGRR